MKTTRKHGMHLLGTLVNCDEKRLLWKNGIYQLLKHIPGKVSMRLIPFANNPFLNFCNNPDVEEDVGYTGVSVLWESHFAIHTWSYYNEVDFDLFSCKDFDYEKILKILKYFFKGEFKETHTYIIKRGRRN